MSSNPKINHTLSVIIPKAKKRKSLTSVYRRFNGILLAVALTPILTVGLFNLVVDAYGVFNSPIFAGFNKAKPEKFNQDLLFKSVEVTKIRPKIIFLGSSRVQWGLDPNYPGLSDPQTSYNLGLQASNMYVVRRYFEHALFNQPELKQVILGIDFLMFNQLIKPTTAFSETRLNKRHIAIQDAINILFSITALQTSKETIDTNLKYADSDYIFVNRFMAKDSIFVKGRMVIDERTEIPGSQEKFIRNMARGFRYFTPYQFSASNLDDLKSIVKTCQERGIDLKIFITPSHAIDLEAIRVNGWWSDFEQWKREVSKVAPVWDFADYNSITTESISNDMTYFIDSFHFNHIAGNLILNRLLPYQLKEVPEDFGVLITEKNIESHLRKIRDEREIWAKKNNKLVQWVEEIKQQAAE